MQHKTNKILFLSQYFPPENSAAAIRVKGFVKYWQGFDDVEINVLTSHPNFPEGKLFDGYKMNWLAKDPTYSTPKLNVYRSWVFLAANKGFIKRGFSYLSTLASFLINGLRMETDLVIATSPPLSVAFCGFLLGKLKRKPFVFDVRDLWPEAIKNTQIKFPHFLYRILFAITLHVYKKSAAVVVCTDNQAATLKGYGVPAEKIYMMSNGVDVSHLFELPKNDPEVVATRKKLNPENQFTIGYVGNFGHLYDFELFLDLAIATKDMGIRYVVGGAGVKKEYILDRIQKDKITNMHFIGQVDHAQMNPVLNALDLWIVPTRDVPINRGSRPFKIFEILACNKPLLFIGDPTGEGISIALRSGIGYGARNNVEDCIRVIKEAQATIGKKQLDREYFSQFNQKTTAEKYYAILKSVIDKK